MTISQFLPRFSIEQVEIITKIYDTRAVKCQVLAHMSENENPTVDPNVIFQPGTKTHYHLY
jgi:hypothetical protein